MVVCPGSKISVVWNGVNPEKYSPEKYAKEDIERIRQRYGIENDESMLLFLGRLTWVKGVRNLLQAMPLILEEYPQTKLVILGKGRSKEMFSKPQRGSESPIKLFAASNLSPKKKEYYITPPQICVFSNQSTSPSEL